MNTYSFSRLYNTVTSPKLGFIYTALLTAHLETFQPRFYLYRFINGTFGDIPTYVQKSWRHSFCFIEIMLLSLELLYVQTLFEQRCIKFYKLMFMDASLC